MKTRYLGLSVVALLTITSLCPTVVLAQQTANEGQTANYKGLPIELQLLLEKGDEQRKTAFADWLYPGTNERVSGGGMSFHWDASTKDDVSKVWSYYVDKLPVLGGGYTDPAEANSKKVPWASDSVKTYTRQEANGFIFVHIQPATFGTIVMQNNEGTFIITIAENKEHINKTKIQMYKFLTKEAEPVVEPVDVPALAQPPAGPQ